MEISNIIGGISWMGLGIMGMYENRNFIGFMTGFGCLLLALKYLVK